MPTHDPISGKPLHVSELTNEDGSITIRGQFDIPPYARLDEEQARFLEVFLRSRGMLNGVERELGVSYPTVRARLDSLLAALQLTPLREEAPRERRSGAQKLSVLEQLEKGEITAEEAKEKLRGAAR